MEKNAGGSKMSTNLLVSYLRGDSEADGKTKRYFSNYYLRKPLTKVSFHCILISNARIMKASIHTILAITICFFSLQTVKAATGDITGNIIEKETQEPVAFAEVTLENGSSKTVIIANEYGHYSANHLPTGKYHVTVKYDNRTVSMNNVQIKDSYTSGINLIVSNNSSVAQTEKIRKDGTTGALRQHDGNNYFDMLVKPTQRPVRAPMASNTQTTEFYLQVSPLAIANAFAA